MATTATLGAERADLSAPYLGSAVRPVTFELDADTDLDIPLETGRVTPATGKSVVVLGMMVVSASAATFSLKSGTGSAHYLNYSLAANSGLHQPFALQAPAVSFHTEAGEKLVLRSTQALSGRLYIVEA